MDPSKVALSEEARQEASEWMHRINSDTETPGQMLGYSNHPSVVIFVTPDFFEGVKTRQLKPGEDFPTSIGGYPVFLSVLPKGPGPIPFATKDDADDFIDRVMPLEGKYLGVVSAASVQIPGGYMVSLHVERRYKRRTVAAIIENHAAGRAVEIDVIGGRARNH